MNTKAGVYDAVRASVDVFGAAGDPVVEGALVHAPSHVPTYSSRRDALEPEASCSAQTDCVRTNEVRVAAKVSPRDMSSSSTFPGRTASSLAASSAKI